MTLIVCRHLTNWIGPMQTDQPRARVEWPWPTIQSQIERELEYLEATSIEVYLDLVDGEDRDEAGWPRAREVDGPQVALVFESVRGPLRFQCDAFIRWQDNVREIGVVLAALRRMERHGVAQKGYQYIGFRASGVYAPEKGTKAAMTVDQAAAFIAAFLEPELGVGFVIQNVNEAYKRAAKVLHPDSGTQHASHEGFHRLQEAKKVLTQSGYA